MVAELAPPPAGVAVAWASASLSPPEEPQPETSAPGRASASTISRSRVIVIGRGEGPLTGRGEPILPAAHDGPRASDARRAAGGGVRRVLESVVERGELLRRDPER